MKGNKVIEKSKVGRPKGRSKEETLAKILPEARRFFAEKGFAQTTIKDVSNSVGLSHAAMYSYFSSKKELYLATINHTQELLLPYYVEAFDEGSNLKECFSLVLKAMAKESDKDSSITGLLAAVPIEMRRHPELYDELSGSNNIIMNLLESVVKDAKENGELKTSASAEDIVAILLGGGVGVSLWQYGYGRGNLEKTMDVFIELVEARVF